MTHPHRYIVTQGEHDEYRILGVFDTEEAAITDILDTFTEPITDPYNVPAIEVWSGPKCIRHTRDGHPDMITVYIATPLESYGDGHVRVRKIPQFTKPVAAFLNRSGDIVGTDRDEVLALMRRVLLEQAEGRINRLMKNIHDES